jgi:phosphoribosylglycinamide formyltransferase-1
MKKIAILASGSGTNAENITKYFQKNRQATVALIASNNTDAGVIQRARKLHVPTLLFDRTSFYKTGQVLDILSRMEIDLIVLAGFMMLIPEDLVRAFEGKIVNIHPALLPKFGGKGMYGNFVHEAVVAAGEIESGITVHFVNEHYDEGQIIFQASCPVLRSDSPEDVAAKVHQLEYEHFPVIIEKVLKEM